MKQNYSLLKIDLLERFESMIQQIDELRCAVHHDSTLPAWVLLSKEDVANQLSIRNKADYLYHSLWYEDGQDGRETLTCPGIIGVSQDTVVAAQACNTAKDSFKTAVLALKSLSKSQTSSLLMELHQRNKEVASAMKRIGAAQLNLKQAYRHIPLLTRRPLKIGFTWSKQGRTIQRTTVAEARRLLERRRETPQTQLELKRLSEIPETEILARVRSVCPHLRANIVFATKTEQVERFLIQAPLPILVPLQVGEKLPEFIPISSEPAGNQRLQRSDVRIQEELFLPSIRIYRYQERYRE